MFMIQLSMQTLVTLLPYERSTQHLPPQLSDIRSHNRSSVVIAPFKTEVMKSENNTIEISYRLSVIVLVSKREN